MKHFYIFFFLSSSLFGSLQAQFFNVRGDAVATAPACFRLTANQGNQEGGVWSTTPLDFSKPFELYNRVSFGTRNGNGADGVSLVFHTGGPLQNLSGIGGSSLGSAGIVPSLVVEMDTWSNGGSADPNFDHIAILSNGNNNHAGIGNVVAPVAIIPGGGNIEDGNFHDVKASWDPGTQVFSVYIDCGPVSISYTGDIVNNFFGGNTSITWGFTSATGGSGRNEHNMCFEDLILPRRDTLNLCEGDTLDLAASPGNSYSWSPAIGLSSTTIGNPRAFPTTSTMYVATVTDICGLTFLDSIFVEVSPAAELMIDLGADTTLCTGQSILLDAYRPGPTYMWQDGLTDSARVVSTAGIYWVDLTNGCGTNRDSIVVSTEIDPVINFGNDTTLCGAATLTLDATTSNGTYIWQDGSMLPQFQVSTAGTYWATASNFCGSDTDSIDVAYQPLPPTNLFVSTDTTLCGSAVMNLDVSLGGATYLWQDGSTLPTRSISTSGLYWVEVSNLCGSIRDSINVTYDLQPDIFLGNDTTLCSGVTRTLDATWTPTSNYLWQDGSTNTTFQATVSGEYWVRVSNACGLDLDTVEIEFVIPPPPVDLGADTLLCEGDVLLLETNEPTFDHVWQDNSTLTNFSTTRSGTIWVVLSNACGASSDTLEAAFNPLPSVFLGNDTLLCDGESIVLDATWPGATYLWNDGFTGPVRTITDPAGYVVSISNSCGVVDTGIVVDFLPVPQAFSFGPDTTLCPGDTLLLSTNQTGFDYFWQDGSDSTWFVVRSPGSYMLQVSNQCAIETSEIFVNYDQLPTVDIGDSVLLCEEELGSLILKLKPSPGVSYLWQDGSTDPSYTVLNGGLVTVEVNNACGVTSDSLLVFTEICNCAVHVPSAFTPNFDGVNDLFKVVPYCNIQESRLKIFDRWGNLMYETDNPDMPWDGNASKGAALEGVYVWVFEYVFPDRNNEPVRTQKSGTLTLIR